MSTDLAVRTASLEPARLPLAPWLDFRTAEPPALTEYIRTLERLCEENPQSVDVRTCLGVAYAVNYDVYKSMDALEVAIQLNNRHFLAQYKYAELHYRLRILHKAERETVKAMELAETASELYVARKQLLEIRRLMREGTQKPEWTKSLVPPAILLGVLMTAVLSMAVMWK